MPLKMRKQNSPAPSAGEGLSSLGRVVQIRQIQIFDRQGSETWEKGGRNPWHFNDQRWIKSWSTWISLNHT